MYMNLLQIFRQNVMVPVKTFAWKYYNHYMLRKDQGISSIKDFILRFFIVSIFITAILWISIFLYVIFHYTYMPNVTHNRPVHLQFKSCDERVGVCSFPSAHVPLMRHSRALMAAQPYRVKLLLEMPESQVNKDLGMFMVCVHMRAKEGVHVATSCRSAMLRHRSRMHQLLHTLTLMPLLLAGLNEEKQQLVIELFTDFQDDQDMPVTDAYVELHSRFAQVYSCELQIEAHFSGLRYFMFHWPKIAAVVGISTNLFFVSLVFMLSWYHLQDGLPDFVKSQLNVEVKSDIVKTEKDSEDDKNDGDWFDSSLNVSRNYKQDDSFSGGTKTKLKIEQDEQDDGGTTQPEHGTGLSVRAMAQESLDDMIYKDFDKIDTSMHFSPSDAFQIS